MKPTHQELLLKRDKNDWLCIELPVAAYGDVWDLQQGLVQARKTGVLDRDLVVILEHEPVFTLGRRGGKQYLTVSEEFLGQKGVPIFHVERGGFITYHGPGQLIVYPIVGLTRARMGVDDFVTRLEEVMIRLCSDWGVDAKRSPKNRGIWVGHEKLGSLGIAVRRGISFHGCALNVSVSLEPFSWIHPCGLEGIQVTSLEKQRGESVPMKKIREAVRTHLQAVFGVDLRDMDPGYLTALLAAKDVAPARKAVL